LRVQDVQAVQIAQAVEQSGDCFEQLKRFELLNVTDMILLAGLPKRSIMT